MKLPYRNSVSVQQIIHKLETYALNFDHSTGRHKAILFRSRLGITLDNKEVLVAAILDEVVRGDASRTKTTQYGEHYLLDFSMTTTVGTSQVRSAWIIQEQCPHLTSVYPIRTKEK